jgi:hypothetical protein
MWFRPVAARKVGLHAVALAAVAGAVLVTVCLANVPRLRAQSSPSAGRVTFHLPDEAAGVDDIVDALISAFDQVDVVALGEFHRRKADSDLRIALVRHPAFARKVRSIVVEFASTTEQATLDRYTQGEEMSPAQLARVWQTTTQAPNGIWEDPMYAAFFAAVREVNATLPAAARIRVLGGDPGPGDHRSREVAAFSVLKEQVLQQHGKALMIYGAAHFYRTLDETYLASMGGDIGIARMLDMNYPGHTFVVIPMEGLARPSAVKDDITPDYRKFDRAVKTPARPVLLSLQRPPFQDFGTEEFLGRTVTSCRESAGCVSAFKGSTLTLGQMADACVYFGASADGDPNTPR